MRALVIFYSVTGNTRRVAGSIADGLRASGVEVFEHDLREGPPPDAAAFDIVGIGLPVHWYRMPAPVRDAIDALGDLSGRSAFVFVLNATYRGAALNRARSALRRARAHEIGVFACRGAGRFLGYTRLGYQFSPGHPDDADLDAAYEFGRGLPSAGEGAVSLRAPDPPTHWVYAVERAAAAPWLARVLYSRWFRVDSGRCTRCGMCARICPSHNIAWERAQLPVWGRDCVLCLTCAEVCPESAIDCPIDWPAFRPFLRYNVRRAGRDPGIEHAQVALRRGKVVRVQAAGPDAGERRE